MNANIIVTLFDSFFNYLREIDVFALLERLDPQDQTRKNVPFIQLVLVFLMKVVGSIKTIDEIRDLLTEELLMSMCGFNAHQIRNGSCDRGTKLRKTPPPQIRGSLCVDRAANHIVTITPRRIENFVSSQYSGDKTEESLSEFRRQPFMNKILTD